MPTKLAITSLEGKGAVATLNRWADLVGQQGNSNEIAIGGNQRAIVELQNAPPPPAGVGDGLIHGDRIWEIDPAFMQFRDDFISPSAQSANAAFTSEQPWFFTGPNNWTAFGNWPPVMGGIQITNSASANQASFLLPAGSDVYDISPNAWTIFEKPSWKMVYNFTILRGQSSTPVSMAPPFDFSHTSFYVGFGATTASTSYNSGNSPRPSFFVGLRFDTDATSPAISDTTFVFEAVTNSANTVNTTRSNVQGNTQVTSLVPTEGSSYRFEMTCTTTGSVLFFLTDGVNTASGTLTVPTFNWTALQYFIQDNYAAVQTNAVNMPASVGTAITVVGTGHIGIDGTHVLQNINGSWGNYQLTAANVGTAFVPLATLSCLPALPPWIAFGNDSTSTPTGFSKSVIIDLVSFIWNPGVGGSGTPNPTLPRYF